MAQIHSLVSDLQLDLELLRNLKHRSIEQKFLYLADDNALTYYKTAILPFIQEALTEENFLNFIAPELTPGESVALVSLGCGNAHKEKYIIETLHKQGINATLYCVDSSRAMLELANTDLKDTSFPYQLICADFTASEFRSEMATTLSPYDRKVFMFLGGTIGNAVQTDIVDTLYNMLNTRDLLWLDCVTRPSRSKHDDLKIFKGYLSRLDDENEMDFCKYILDMIHIPSENGKMTLETIQEESIGVLCFRYSFQFLKPSVANYRGETLHFLPPEKIKLLDIRVYHPETMVHYMEAHGLTFVKQQIKGNDGQFLFSRL